MSVTCELKGQNALGTTVLPLTGLGSLDISLFLRESRGLALVSIEMLMLGVGNSRTVPKC